MKKIISLALMFCLILISLSACSSKEDEKIVESTEETTIETTEETINEVKEEKTDIVADLVVYGTIWTAEDENDVVEAFAVKDGKYVYVGNVDGVKPFIKDGVTEIIDRSGEGLIIPGCTEGHGHYFSGCGMNALLPGSGHSYEEVLEILKEKVEKEDIKQFVSFGYNAMEVKKDKDAFKNFAEEIEKIAPNVPVVLIDNSGHNAICNTTALKNAGLLENPKVRGGEVVVDANGIPTGYVSDQAVGYVTEKNINKPLTDEEYEKACTVAVNTLLRLGYTNTLDAWLNMYDSSTIYETIKRMDEAGNMPMNVAGCYNLKSYDADNYQEKVDDAVRVVNEYKSKHLNPAFIKLFTDGVVEAKTGWMIEPYKNVKEGKEYGNQIWEPYELEKVVTYANSKNILIHTHSYGDAACKATIDAYIASNKANGKEYRNCLAHVRNIQKEDIVRVAENKISLAENLLWHTGYNDNKPDEAKMKKDLLNTISEETYYSGYPMKSFIDNGVVVSSSTDAPAAVTVEGNVMNILEIATTGKQPNEDGAEAFAPEELLTIREALKALTINGAWQLGLENERGSIKVGKYADFLIFDKNILDYQEEEFNKISDTKLLNTYFEGKNVYTINNEESEKKNKLETSKFTANIDKYWKEHNIDDAIKNLHATEDELAENRSKMLKMYGENKEILGEYDETLSAKTISGIYVGKVVDDNIVSWKGVPFAKQPVGALRWKAPQKPDKSDKVYEAYYFGHSSLQVEGNDEPSSLYPQGEDCLNLNVWNNFSDDTKNKPIMVWIHGGAYIQGGASTEEYDGTNFVKDHHDVIFVSIDYRTDFLGFINLSKVSGAEEYKDTANLGLLDEIQAFSWLKENAKAFGGDPDRITIFGESAGGGSVSTLTIAPQAKGLFKRGIMQSGVTTAYLRTAKKSIEHTDEIMNISGVKNFDDFMSLTESDIRKIETICYYEKEIDYTFPQRDDIVIPMDIRGALDSDSRNGIDIMIGTTKDEYNYWTMLLGKEKNMKTMQKLVDDTFVDMNDEQKNNFEKFMSLQEGDEYNKLLQFVNYRSFHSPARYEAESHIKNGQNVYVYYFTEESTNKDLLSHHGFDVGFVLGNIEENNVKDVASAKKLSKIMQRMWVNFAKTGDPSIKTSEVDGVSELKWDKYKADDYKVMVFDSENTRLENDPIKEKNDLIKDLFWLRIKDN